MKKFARDFLIKKIIEAFRVSEVYIGDEIKRYPKKSIKILDIGCRNGEVTKKILMDCNKKYRLYGLDLIEPEKVDKDIQYKRQFFDNKSLPYKSNSFDILIVNQVIEHIIHKDKLIEECHRILKKGGVCFTATENIASIDNAISLLFGQDPISQHTSTKYHIGTFFSPHFMEKMPPFEIDFHMGHKNVCSYFGIQRLFKVNGFRKVTIKSFGHINGILEKLFPFQNRIIVVKSTK